MFNKKLKQEHEKLKQKIKIFEEFTDISFDKWCQDIGTLEHTYHSKMEEVNNKEAEVNAREKMFEKELEAERSKAIGEKEKKYYHDLRSLVEKQAEQYTELMKTMTKKLPTVDLKDLSITTNVNNKKTKK